MQEKLKELMSDEAFVKELFAQEDYEAASLLFSEKDIDLSAEELREVVKLAKAHPDGALTEEELENVSGGSPDVLLCLFTIGTCIVWLNKDDDHC